MDVDQARELRADTLFELKYLHDARLSPNGKLVAYVISDTKGVENYQISIIDLNSGQGWCLPYDGNATAPRWSPDGRWIAFSADQTLRIAAFPSLEISDPLTPERLRVAGAPAWAPDSKSLCISLVRQVEHAGPLRILETHFRIESLGYTQSLSQNIYIIRLGGRPLEPLPPSEHRRSQPEWSPCGKRILFLETEGVSRQTLYPTRLMQFEPDIGQLTPILDTGWTFACARWIPDSNRIAMVAALHSPFNAPNFSLWVTDHHGHMLESRINEAIGNVGFYIQHDMPLSDRMYGVNSIVVADRNTAYVTVQSRGSAEIWRVTLENAVHKDCITSGERSCLILDVHTETDLLLYAETDLHRPTELWRTSLDGTRRARITALNDAVLSSWPEFRVEQFSFRSSDGVDIDAWFLCPATSGGYLPTVLFIHGGPFASTGNAFRYDFRLLSSQGYGVLFANYRGSAGYDEQFRQKLSGHWGLSYPDHIGAVEAAVARGLADSDRLGVWGHSYGGFATCWIIGHTNRFKAALAEAAFTNCTTHYYLTDAPGIQERFLGGKPHEIPDIYRACSPVSYAHRCRTPTMLVHGESDLRCPISEAEQFHRLLKDIGCESQLFRIPDCTHLGDSLGPLSARQAQNDALMFWFGKHLR